MCRAALAEGGHRVGLGLGYRVVGGDGEDALIDALSLSVLAHGGEQLAELVVGVGVVWRQTDHLMEGRDCLVLPVGLERDVDDRPLLLRRLGQAPHLEIQRDERVPVVDLVRSEGDDPLV